MLRPFSHWRSFIPEAVSFASGILLSFAFPSHAEPTLAWFALVPLLLLTRNTPRKRAFRLGFFYGFGFWLFSILWFWILIENGGPWPLVLLGHLALSAYCALYIGLFALLHASFPARSSSGFDLLRIFFAAIVWTGLEWIRSTFLSGFAWNHLGVSQVRSLPLLQWASFGGVYALSFLIVLVNTALANVALRLYHRFRHKPAPGHHLDLVVALSLLLLAILGGIHLQRLWTTREADSALFVVAGVQPDAPSIFERGEESIQESIQRLSDRTTLISRFNPDLVVWPETVLPGSVPSGTDAIQFTFALASHCKAPILAGALEYYEPETENDFPLIANASWLFGPDRNLHGTYRKQHLVPFGEYIPLDRLFPFLQYLSPAGFSCTPGEGPAVFPVASQAGKNPVRISPLICFEDTVSSLAVKAVRQGATILVNQSNDAWFEGSSEGLQHHSQAVFRAVETRTPLVRISNGGVSGIISASGRQSTPVVYYCQPVSPRQNDWPQTLYTRFGDWTLGIPSALLTLLFFLWVSPTSFRPYGIGRPASRG